MRLLSALLFFGLIISFNLPAQQPPSCGTDEAVQMLKASDPEFAQNYEQSRAAAIEAAANATPQRKSGMVYTVPVVVHVIHSTQNDNISKGQIEDAIRALNDDFRRMNSDTNNTRSIFKDKAADVEIEFALAKKDPDGNCTDGITRTYSPQAVNAHDNVKDLVHWDHKKYLNIWVVNSINSQSSGITLGYAYLPHYNQNDEHDGVLIRHDRMGTIGTSTGTGRTLTHEVGHYLGLQHTFHGGCSGAGDGIADTPPASGANYGCQKHRNSCSSDTLPDMVENYMDYSDDHCMNLFTLGQKNLVRGNFQTFSHRGGLVQPSNLQFAGLDNNVTCAPVADISVSKTSTCALDTIRFYDQSKGADTINGTRIWHFPGGQPSVSSNPNPAVTYPASGTYDVSLVVSNPTGTDTIYLKDYVSVRSYNSQYESEWIEDFEAELPFPEVGVLSHGDTIEFITSSSAASSGSGALFLNNFQTNGAGDVDEFISPNIFTDHADGLKMKFDYAFATKSMGDNDVLKVYVSKDCGKTWAMNKILPALALKTVNSPVLTPFVPGADDWETTTVHLGSYVDQGPILIKFEYTNGGGNNLYIDNINLTANNVSVDEVDLEGRLSVYPNPAQDVVNINFSGGAPADMQVNLVDLYGKNIRTLELNRGQKHLSIERGDIASGVYLINISDGENSFTKKLVIQ